MAEWKKIVVSGSAISQLNNDSNYLVVTDTIDSASVAARATTLSAAATASFADSATTASIADKLSQLATASHALTAVTASHALNVPDTASFALNAQSASVAARATTLSSAATASFADVAGTVHDGNITAAKIATDAVTTDKILNGNVTNAKLANDSVTIGATEIDLGTTAASLTGLTSISATTGSFVLQVFESSSTIITSGSNIFGDAQNDIQQFTGSILQTGSMTTTGTITADEVSSDKFSGSFSGSFEGLIDSASTAIRATSASATVAGLLFPVADGIANQALVTDGAGQMSYGDIFGTGSTKKLNQSVAAVTWSFAHSLNELYPIVQVYDSNGDQLIPERVESIDVNNVKLYFATATEGVAAAMVGGMGISASNATRATSASIADEASTLSATATASIADFATSASHAATGDGIFSGSFSGSFQGDGSSLTGLATSLTVDGDTGTQDVELTTDDLQIIGTTNEIETAVTKVGNDVKVTVGLPSDVTIGQDLTVTRNATIAGDLVVDGSIVSASSLAVEDQFIILASGSNGAIDGGIIINQVDDHPDGKGVAFAYDSSANRWALETGLNDSASVITPDAFMGVIQESAGAPASDPTYGGTSGKGTIFVDTSNDEAYIYV